MLFLVARRLTLNVELKSQEIVSSKRWMGEVRVQTARFAPKPEKSPVERKQRIGWKYPPSHFLADGMIATKREEISSGSKTQAESDFFGSF